MRVIYILFLSALLFSLSINKVFSQNLIAHYTFDNNTKDISGNNNNGIIIGNIQPSIDRFGNYCGALSFNGFNSYIEVPDSKSLSSISNKITLTCWFKMQQNQADPISKWLTLICKGESVIETKNNPQYRVQIFQSNSQSTVSVNTEFTKYDNNYNNHIIEFDKWYFYSLVYNGDEVITYLDGVKIWEYNYTGIFNNNNMPLNIGRDVPGSLEYFCGSLDDLRIYNGVLSDKAIMKLYNDNTGSAFQEPFTIKCPDNISVNTSANECFAVVKYKDPEFKINCGDASMKMTKGLPSGSSFPVGNTSITYKVESSVGRKKTCSFNVTVIDKIAALIKCPDDIKLYVEENINSINYIYNAPIVSDACGIESVLLTSGIKSGDNFPIGNTENKYKVTDLNGNISECSFNVTVLKKQVNKNTNSQIPNNISPVITPITNVDSIDKLRSANEMKEQEELDKIQTNRKALEENIAKLQEQQSKITDDKDKLIADKDKLSTEKKKMNDSLLQMQEERDKLIADKAKIEQDRITLELLKKQQEKQVLDLKRTIDSLSKVKQDITTKNQAAVKYDLFNVPLEVGAIAQINNIYFVADASFLQIPSYAELDKVVLFLNKNNNLKVEIVGHTNGLCDDAFCNKLSENRAKACVDYLISKGIESKRLKYKGYGKSQLLMPASPTNSLNQRVEIKITGV